MEASTVYVKPILGQEERVCVLPGHEERICVLPGREENAFIASWT